MQTHTPRVVARGGAGLTHAHRHALALPAPWLNK